MLPDAEPGVAAAGIVALLGLVTTLPGLEETARTAWAATNGLWPVLERMAVWIVALPAKMLPSITGPAARAAGFLDSLAPIVAGSAATAMVAAIVWIVGRDLSRPEWHGARR